MGEWASIVSNKLRGGPQLESGPVLERWASRENTVDRDFKILLQLHIDIKIEHRGHLLSNKMSVLIRVMC